MRLRIALGLLAAAALAAAAAWWTWPPTRRVYLGGPILTIDAADRVVEALGVQGPRIGAVGTRDEVLAWAGPGAQIVDLGGRALLPGFVDAHGHFPGSGITAVYVDLSPPPVGDVSSLATLVERLRARAAQKPPGEWVIGWSYDDSLLAERRHPTRADLDRASSEHPIVAYHISGHLCALNSAALARVGLDASTPDPPGGRIRRDDSGAPDGVLEETALELLRGVLPPPTLREAWAIFREGTRRTLAAGVTTAQNGYAEEVQLAPLVWLARLHLLPLRLVVWPREQVAARLLAGELAFDPPDPDRVRRGAVKFLADGSIQGYTAYLTRPYFVPPGGDPGYRGWPRIPREELFAQVERFHRAGWQIAVHANGDAEIDDVLDAFESAQRAFPRDDARHVVVHAQMARDDQLDRMQRLGVIPSFFVLHVYYWGDRHRDVFLGPERAARISPLRSAEERGLRFTLHADTPVVPLEPLRIVWAAVNRRTTSGAVLGPEQRIGVARALRAVTVDAAWQGFEEATKGSLEPGKLADLVILSRSPLDDPATIDRIQVLETIVGGETVWRADTADAAR